MAEQRKKIAIIGGGLAGAVSIVNLLEEGHTPLCFEKTDRFGGTFCYREETIDGVGSVMSTTVLNHNKEIGAISNFPPPKEFSTIMHTREYYQYITNYYENHKCQEYMVFNAEVVHVKKNRDYDETGRFLVTVKDTISGRLSTDMFDGVIVANGHFHTPKKITFPGMDKFKGNLIHTHDLKTVEKFRDKNVLVIGTGCSGFDAAVESSSVARNVYISTRSGSYVFSRLALFGYPIDYVLLRQYTVRALDILPRNVVSWFIEKSILDAKFDHLLYPVLPQYHMLSKDPVVNDAITSKLLSGAVVMKKNVQHFTETGVIFDGEETVTEIDDVILATGYIYDFSFLDDGLLEVENGRINLYKCVYPPQLQHATLCFVGFINPFGPGTPLGEMQIRWITQVFSGKRKLPPQDVMLKEVIERHEKNEREYAPSEFNGVRVDFFQYFESIASEIGTQPKLAKYLFTDFPLFLKLTFGPILPYHYRLEGPHKWEGARNAIMTCNERLFYPLTKNAKRKRGLLQTCFEIIGNLVPRNIFF